MPPISFAHFVDDRAPRMVNAAGGGRAAGATKQAGSRTRIPRHFLTSLHEDHFRTQLNQYTAPHSITRGQKRSELVRGNLHLERHCHAIASPRQPRSAHLMSAHSEEGSREEVGIRNVEQP